MIGHPSNEARYRSREDYFRELERVRTQALVKPDLPLAWQLHAPGYMLITPSGTTFTRERYLGMIESGGLRYGRWEPGEMSVRVGIGMAVVRYEVTLAFLADAVMGEPFKCWHTDSYELTGGTWQALWSQATRIV